MQSTEGRLGLGLELGLGLVRVRIRVRVRVRIRIRIRIRIRVSDPRWIASSAHRLSRLPWDSPWKYWDEFISSNQNAPCRTFVPVSAPCRTFGTWLAWEIYVHMGNVHPMHFTEIQPSSRWDLT